jgi:hypothetical protein
MARGGLVERGLRRERARSAHPNGQVALMMRVLADEKSMK